MFRSKNDERFSNKYRKVLQGLRGMRKQSIQQWPTMKI